MESLNLLGHDGYFGLVVRSYLLIGLGGLELKLMMQLLNLLLNIDEYLIESFIFLRHEGQSNLRL